MNWYVEWDLIQVLGRGSIVAAISFFDQPHEGYKAESQQSTGPLTSLEACYRMNLTRK